MQSVVSHSLKDPIVFDYLQNQEIDVLARVFEIGQPTIRRAIEEKLKGKYGWYVIQRALDALVYHKILQVREEAHGEYTRALYFTTDENLSKWRMARFNFMVQFKKMSIEEAERKLGDRRIRFYLLTEA